ncbi:MAG: hypothetical protein U9R73_06560 [Pseudomonadota bacterium]|nr:hypothetical protein [Pseudomonadota bacterium]
MRTQEIKVGIDEKSARIANDLIDLHRQAKAVLNTIFSAEMLSSMPAAEEYREKHDAALSLLEMLLERLNTVPADEALVPSPYAFEAAKEAAAAS